MIFQSQLFFYRITGKIQSDVRGVCGGVCRDFWCVILTACLFAASACTQPPSAPRQPGQRSPLSTDSTKNFHPLQVNSVVVLPFEVVDSPDSHHVELSESLVDALERRTSLEILNKTEAAKSNDQISHVRTLPIPLRDQAVQLGHATGAQGVIYGLITKYEEMSGSRMGTERLSHVGFRLWLVDARSGDMLWTASYDNADEPLSDNLFRLGEKLKSGVGFRTGPELAKLGFEAAADDLERIRQASSGSPH